MKNLFSKIALMTITMVLVIAFASCGKHKGFTKDETGFYYKFYVENTDSAKLDEGSYVVFTHRLYTVDTVLFEDYPMEWMIQEPVFAGDLNDALLHLHNGDSVTLIFNADSFAHYYFGMDDFQPDLKEREIYIDLKVVAAFTSAQVLEMQQKRNEEMAALRDSEAERMAQYIAENNITAAPQASGLIYVKKSAGKGAKAVDGKLVSVHYTGKLLDGAVFDSSVERGEPIQFILGAHQVIPGWEEGIALMQEGEKGTLLIPSDLAYGEYGQGPIAPYSPLVFDVELVKVEDAPQAAAPAIAQ